MTYIYLIATAEMEEDVLTAVEMWLWHTFGFEVRGLEQLTDPDFAYDAKRNQYSSSLILQKLLAACPPDAEKLLALTSKDLFIPMLSFVFGQAQLSGKLAIVSIARLNQKFYGFSENRPLMLARALKEVVHEVGHTFGLVHCLDKRCPMSLSTDIRQVDAKGDEFCRDCAMILRENISAQKMSL